MKRSDNEIQEFRKRYPNIPDHAIPGTKAKKKNPTNQLQGDIIDYVKRLGGYAFRVNTMGTYSEALGKYIKNGGTKGTSDIIICFDGLLIACEVKRGKDRQRPEQIKFQQMIEQAKGRYIIASDIESFKLQIHNIINTI